MGILLLLSCLSPCQSDPEAHRIQSFIENLRSEDPAVREAARSALLGIGRSAVPALERAALHPEPDVALSARQLLRSIRYKGFFTDNLRRKHPTLQARLEAGTPNESTRAFLALAEGPKTVCPRDLQGLLVPALEGADDRERRRICESIGRWRLYAAAPVCGELLDNPDRDVRLAAMAAIRDLHARRFIPKIRRIVDEDDTKIGPDHELGALRILADLGAKELIPRFEQLLDHESEGVRHQALNSLLTLGALETAPTIARLMLHPDHSDQRPIRSILLRTLADWSAPQAVPFLEQEIKRLSASSTDSELCDLADAWVMLSRYQGKVTVPELLRALLEVPEAPQANADEIARRRLRDAVLRHAVPQDAPSFIPLLSNKLPDVRECGLYLISRVPPPEVGALARRSLSDTDPQVIAAAVSALAELGVREAIGDIALLLDNPWNRWNAAAALGRLNAQDQGNSLEKLLDLELGHPYGYGVVIEALARMGRGSSVPRIVPFLGKAEVRMSAAMALGELGDKNAIPALAKCFGGPARSWEVACVADALERLDARESGVVLKEYLQHDDPERRYQAAAALCRLGVRAGAPAVMDWGEDRGALNALRSPALWKKLAGIPFQGNVEGTRQEILEAVARQAGLTIERPESFPAARYWSSMPLRRFGGRLPFVRLSGILLRVMQEGPWDVVLEGDRLRLIPHEEADRFWRSWWAEKGKE